MTHTRPSHHRRAALRACTRTLLAASVTLTACSPDDITTGGTSGPAALSLSIGDTARLASLGDSITITRQVTDAAGSTLRGVPVRWTLSTSGVVAQDADGVFRAIANGEVTITAEVDDGERGVRPAGYYAARVADSVVVRVQQQVALLSLSAVDTAFSTLGAARTLVVRMTDARGNALASTMPPLTWLAANPAVVTVDSLGVVRSLSEGTGGISVAAAGLSGGATFTVRPRVPHTACMVFSKRRRTQQACATLSITMRERGVTP